MEGVDAGVVASCEGAHVRLRELAEAQAEAQVQAAGAFERMIRDCSLRLHKLEDGRVGIQVAADEQTQWLFLEHRDDVVSHGTTSVEVKAQAEWDGLLVSITQADRYFVQRLLQLVQAIVPRIAPGSFYKQRDHELKLHPTYNVNKMFFRQEQAFQYYDSLACTDSVKIFSFESPFTGVRKFLVMSFPLFLARYCSSPAESRHVYEIIREDQPCRAYFDLEFHVPSNPGVDGDALMAKWRHMVADKIRELFALDVQEDGFVELDSSTPEKFSRHVTLRLPDDRLFTNNIEVGKLVAAILTPERSAAAVADETDHAESPMKRSRSGSPIDELLVTSKSGEKQLFVDTSVYTKNRAFRLFLSRKFGKTATLALAPSRRPYVLSGTDAGITFKEMVQKILLASFATPLDALQRDQQSLLAIPDFDMDPQLHRLLPTVAPRTPFQAAGSLSGTNNSPSPFPAIDRFIESVANKGGVQGQIRDWKYTVSKLAADASRLITYRIAHNRWCDNIGRAHKSNHILFVVDLNFGVYFQKCMDPECRAAEYRSPAAPVPPELLPTLDYLNDVDFECAISAALAEEPDKWAPICSG